MNLFDPFVSIIPPSMTANAAHADLSLIKERVVGALDIRKEFADLGVIFTGKPATYPGCWECHGYGRKAGKEDDRPSAFVNATTGIYFDSGSGEKGRHLFKFAVDFGPHGRWIDALRHYADKAGIEVGTIKPASKGRYLERTFDYHEADGRVRYRVWRYILPTGKKDITQHPLDKNGNVIWDKGAMLNVAPLPYRLTHLHEAENSWLWIAEGENKVEELVSRGLIATSAHGGTGNAAKNWPRIVSHFKGYDVVYLTDNDDAGHKAGEIACRELTGLAASVRRLDLPGLPVGGDVVDYLANGGTRDQLEALAEACSLWTPQTDHIDQDVEVVDDDDLDRDATAEDLARVMSDEAWLWKGWIPTSALTLLAAQAGKGKTRFLMDLHRRLYNGHPWPDESWPINPVDQPKVLWIAGDRQYRELMNIPNSFGIPRDRVILNTKRRDPFGGRMLENEAEWDDLEERIMRVKPIFVAIDTITKTGHFKSQDSVDAMKQYGPLADIAVRCQVPIICVTHLSKAGNALGVRAIESVRTVIQLEHSDPSQANRRRLWVDKSFDEIPPVLGITMTGDGNEYDLNPPEKVEEGTTPHRAAQSKTPTPKVLECAEWLDGIITEQPVRVSAIRNQATEKSISVSILYKAKDHLGIIQTEEDGYKFWHRPPAA